MQSKRSVVSLIVIALVAAVAGALLARHLGRAPVALQNGTLFPERRPIADFRLADHEGAAFGNAQLKGHPSLLF